MLVVDNFIKAINKQKNPLNIKILQTEKGQVAFQECISKIEKNLAQWKTVWKMKEIEMFPNVVIRDCIGRKCRYSIFTTTKKHFENILEELQTGGETKEYLNIEKLYEKT